jgi:hypothetical protein
MPTALLTLAALGYVLALAVHAWHAKRARRFTETHTRLFWHAKQAHDRRLADALTRANRAEHACEELRKQVMRGSSVATLNRKSTNARADLDIDVVSIEGQPHAFTDSVLPRAKNLYRHLVATKQIQPLPHRES